MKHQRLPASISLVVLFVITTLFIGIGGARSGAQDHSQGRSVQDTSSPDVLLLGLEPYASGLNQPVGLASAGDLRLFVVEKAGRIKVIEYGGAVRATPFLDIRSRVDSSGFEKGLLGLAFHPNYRENGLFYVNYTNTTQGVLRTRISRFRVTADPNIADPRSEEVLLTVDQPAANHNAGKIMFGPDGYLYIPLGDGGGNSGPGAQVNTTLLGKISRIDVGGGSGSPADCRGSGWGRYKVPADNPFVDGPGNNCDEIWASGLRNPWQSSFDTMTGDLFVADVGQSTVEEVNFQPADSTGGENYGWPCYEGSAQYDLTGCQSPDKYVFPIFEYERPTGYNDCSVTGGYVYWGRQYPALRGRYLLTDYCSGRFWDLQHLPEDSWQATAHNYVFLPGPDEPASGNAAFGQRCDGELFMANILQGQVYQLTGKEKVPVPDGVREAHLVDAPLPSAYLPIMMISSCW